MTDDDLTNFASLTIPVGLAASVSLTVNGGVGTITPGASGRTVGFVVVDPSAVLTLALLDTVSVSTVSVAADQTTVTPVETTSATNPLQLNLLGLLSSGTGAFISFTAHQPFNGLAITDGTGVGVLTVLNVYTACVANSDIGAGGG